MYLKIHFGLGVRIYIIYILVPSGNNILLCIRKLDYEELTNIRLLNLLYK